MLMGTDNRIKKEERIILQSDELIIIPVINIHVGHGDISGIEDREDYDQQDQY